VIFRIDERKIHSWIIGAQTFRARPDVQSEEIQQQESMIRAGPWCTATKLYVERPVCYWLTMSYREVAGIVDANLGLCSASMGRRKGPMRSLSVDSFSDAD
jgi:hypothetical protein